jgi:hypothetical protein
MLCRVSAAVAAAAIAAMLLVPAQSNARGGVGMGGHGGGFRPPMRPTHPVQHPFVHRHDPLFVRRAFHEKHAFEHRRDRRNVVGFVGYGYGGYGYGGNGYGDNGYADNGYGDNGYGGNVYGGNLYGGNRYCNYGYGYKYPLTCGKYGAFYGTYYDPSDMTRSTWFPSSAAPRASVMPVAEQLETPINRGGCRSESVAVPAADGTENSVTITRC